MKKITIEEALKEIQLIHENRKGSFLIISTRGNTINVMINGKWQNISEAMADIMKQDPSKEKIIKDIIQLLAKLMKTTQYSFN